MSYSAKVQLLTSDPGARFLGGVVDDLKSQIDALKARVDACCDDSPAPIAPPGHAKDAAPVSPAAKDR